MLSATTADNNNSVVKEEQFSENANVVYNIPDEPIASCSTEQIYPSFSGYSKITINICVLIGSVIHPQSRYLKMLKCEWKISNKILIVQQCSGLVSGFDS